MIVEEKNGGVCCRLGSSKMNESGARSSGAWTVQLSPGRRVVLVGILTSLCLDLVSIVSRVRREGGEDCKVQWSPIWIVPLDILEYTSFSTW